MIEISRIMRRFVEQIVSTDYSILSSIEPFSIEVIMPGVTSIDFSRLIYHIGDVSIRIISTEYEITEINNIKYNIDMPDELLDFVLDFISKSIKKLDDTITRMYISKRIFRLYKSALSKNPNLKNIIVEPDIIESVLIDYASGDYSRREYDYELIASITIVIVESNYYQVGSIGINITFYIRNKDNTKSTAILSLYEIADIEKEKED